MYLCYLPLGAATSGNGAPLTAKSGDPVSHRPLPFLPALYKYSRLSRRRNQRPSFFLQPAAANPHPVLTGPAPSCPLPLRQSAVPLRCCRRTAPRLMPFHWFHWELLRSVLPVDCGLMRPGTMLRFHIKHSCCDMCGSSSLEWSLLTSSTDSGNRPCIHWHH